MLRFPYHDGDTRITAPGVKLTDLPGGPIDHHWTKSMVASADGSKLYVGVGSNSNITENGLPAELNRAAVWEIDRTTGASRLYATGMRNPTNLTLAPGGKLWAVVNERDELGPDLVPDYMTNVHDGAFYGWPYSYYGQHLDPRVMPQRPDLVAKAIKPDYALGSHVAALGIAWYDTNGLPAAYRGGMFVGEHGSWTAPRSAATRWCSCLSRMGDRREWRRMLSPGSSAAPIRHTAARLVSPSTRRVRCLSPMMSATRFGG